MSIVKNKKLGRYEVIRKTDGKLLFKSVFELDCVQYVYAKGGRKYV